MSDQDRFNVIIDEVCKYLGMPYCDVRQNKRNRDLTEARMYIYHFGRKHTDLSLMNIGERFTKDHATVMHGIRVLDDLKDQQPFKKNIAFLDHYICRALSINDRALVEKEICDTAVSMGGY